MPYIVIGGVLYHYDIPGMKCGKRRFQNKDGSLTEAGKKRYARSVNSEVVRNKHRGGVYKEIYEDVKERFPKEYQSLVSARDEYLTAQAIRDDLHVRGSEEYRTERNSLRSSALKRWADKGVVITDILDLDKLSREDRAAYTDEMNAIDDISYSRASDALMAKRGYDSARLEAIKDNYSAACGDLVNSMLGTYGDRPLTLWKSSSGTTGVRRTAETVNDFVNSAIKRESFADFWYEGWGERPSNRRS